VETNQVREALNNPMMTDFSTQECKYMPISFLPLQLSYHDQILITVKLPRPFEMHTENSYRNKRHWRYYGSLS